MTIPDSARAPEVSAELAETYIGVKTPPMPDPPTRLRHPHQGGPDHRRGPLGPGDVNYHL